MEHRRVLRALAGLDEKHARRIVGLLAEKEGHGGVSLLSRVTGMSRTTIILGQQELQEKNTVPKNQMHRPGKSRKPLEKKDPN